MKGKEALGILNQITEIANYLLEDDEKRAFYQIGILTEELAQIVRIDQVSFKPTVDKED